MTAEEKKTSDHVIYIGKKGIMSYVLAVITQLNQEDVKEITIIARGKLTARAIDVALMVTERFLPNVEVANIKIKTEELPNEDGQVSRVSAIEILLRKKSS